MQPEPSTYILTYIVDVNKTDLGPVIALSWADKIRSMNRLSRALSGLIQPDK